jgi:SulP family sulfate permease
VARVVESDWHGFGEGPRQEDRSVLASAHDSLTLLLRPLHLLRRYPRSALHADIVAGVTVGMVLLPQALAFSLLAGLPPRFIAAVGLIAVMAGVIRLALGLARLGMLVNFVSDSVAVGFTAGAGILIISNQLAPLTRISAAGDPG